jgi:hypothetical protein
VTRPLQRAAHRVTVEIDKQAHRARTCPRKYDKFLIGNDLNHWSMWSCAWFWWYLRDGEKLRRCDSIERDQRVELAIGNA